MVIAIVSVANKRVTKFKQFEDRAEAEAHIEKFDGVNVFEYDGDPLDLLVADDGSVSISPRPPKEISEERLRAKAIRAIEDRLLQEEMAKPNPIPEVAALKARKGK